jgi:hypothetical protein
MHFLCSADDQLAYKDLTAVRRMSGDGRLRAGVGTGPYPNLNHATKPLHDRRLGALGFWGKGPQGVQLRLLRSAVATIDAGHRRNDSGVGEVQSQF